MQSGMANGGVVEEVEVNGQKHEELADDDENGGRVNTTDLVRKQNEEFERSQNKRKAQYLKDFKEEKNANDTMDEDEIEKLDRYAKFEK